MNPPTVSLTEFIKNLRRYNLPDTYVNLSAAEKILNRLQVEPIFDSDNVDRYFPDYRSWSYIVFLIDTRSYFVDIYTVSKDDKFIADKQLEQLKNATEFAKRFGGNCGYDYLEKMVRDPIWNLYDIHSSPSGKETLHQTLSSRLSRIIDNNDYDKKVVHDLFSESLLKEFKHHNIRIISGI